jgi:hypothetical protein
MRPAERATPNISTWPYMMQDPEKMVDAQTALQEMETQALTILQTADARRGASPVIVATVAPTPVLASNEIAIRFGLLPLPNEDLWRQTVDNFVADDLEVGYVELDTSSGGPEDPMETHDCIFLPYNRVSPTGIEQLLT